MGVAPATDRVCNAHECNPDDTVEAIILYPSLGMPMVLAPGQKKCNLIIATGEEACIPFGIKEKDGEVLSACSHVARHLRLTPMDEAKHLHIGNTTDGELYSDDRLCCTAQKAIRVWHLGKITEKGETLIYNRRIVEDGNEQKRFPFATLAPLLTEAEGPYPGLTDLWEVELTLNDQLHTKIDGDKFLNWAWLVETDKKKKHRKAFEAGNYFIKNGAHHEPQDRMIDAYLRKLTADQKEPLYRHFDADRLFEVALHDTLATPESCPLPLGDSSRGSHYATRLQSWHPVIRAASLPLRIAHFTDMHINIRQATLARSTACVIEEATEKAVDKPAVETEAADTVRGKEVGKKVCHSFLAIKHLIDTIAQEKIKPALLLTGDYVDFNRNLAPREPQPQDSPPQEPQGAATAIGELWKDFNILANYENPKKYPRGLDNILIYSLVRNAYVQHRLPVFMITGNHEAYQMPYGISPRRGFRTIWMGLKEIFGFSTEAQKRDLEAASQWAEGKADSRIASDHNLTFYEATLAYGPTYTHLVTTDDFKAEQFDWFHTLFAPFSNAILPLGSEPHENGRNAQQLLTLLGWGADENLRNLLDLLPLGGADAQDIGILPRASQSFSDHQQQLLARAKKLAQVKASGAPFILGTHFTLISYEPKTAFKDDVVFGPANYATGLNGARPPAFNEANSGACELKQRWFFNHMVTGDGALDWHLAGHSHRPGVYQIELQSETNMKDWPTVKVTKALDPGLQGEPERRSLTLKDGGTRFIVSGSAGPLGLQNLDHVLSCWYLRPPSGSLVDTQALTVRQILNKHQGSNEWDNNEKPRLCVILDYLTVDNPNKETTTVRSRPDKKTNPIPFLFDYQAKRSRPNLLFADEIGFRISEEMVELDCLDITKMKVWLFNGEKTKKGPSGQWEILDVGKSAATRKPWLGDEIKTEWRITLTQKQLEKLSDCLVTPLTRAELRAIKEENEREAEEKAAKNSKGHVAVQRVLQAFCEIPLKVPNIVGKDDLNCDDPWVFPLEIGCVELQPAFEDQPPSLGYYFRRPYGEKGEVPDWWFRAKYFKRKGYIPAEEAIIPYENTQGKTSDSTDDSSRSSKS